MQKNGAFLQADFFDNTGGLNTSSSPYAVQDGESTGGANYSYAKSGAITTRRGHALVNTSPDSSLLTLGLGLHVTGTGTKTNVRAADRKIQAVNVDASTFTVLTDDTVSAASNVFAASTAQPVVFSQFNTALGNTLWFAGGGASTVNGVTSATKYTANGVATPTGTITATQSAAGTGAFTSTGTYFYGIAFRKASTSALSNVALDKSATITATTDNVTINWSGVSIDTTLYDKVYIYRSAVAGVTAFTTGDIIAQVSSSLTSYVDTGSYISTAQNVPRAGNLLLDNSQLATGTYNVLTTWKRRLVTASGSSLYFSDLNKPESWPVGNTITIPSGGPITGLAIISFSSALSNDEYLVVFKERELWIVTGSTLSDWSLKFIDQVGCQNQPLIVTANGYLFWIDYRGIYLWDGDGKPAYTSKPIEDLFELDGSLDKANLALGCGVFARKQHEVIWYLSHKQYGTQKFAIRLDLRLTLPRMGSGMEGRTLDGCFLFDSCSIPVYSAFSYIPQTNTDEVVLLGDNAGSLFKANTVYADNGSAYSFTYLTKYIHCGNPNTNKRFFKVIVWLDQVGTWPLYLDYWTGLKADAQIKSTVTANISTSESNTTALWDIGFWDAAYWDQYVPRGTPLIFNLKADLNNASEGSGIRLQFRQDSVTSPVTINGFSIIFNEMGMISERGTV